MQTFIRGIERDRLNAALLLLLMGFRPAEVVGLRWKYLDMKLATLEIARTRTMIGNVTVLEKDAKAEAGERALPLPGSVLTPCRGSARSKAERSSQLGRATPTRGTSSSTRWGYRGTRGTCASTPGTASTGAIKKRVREIIF
ncbi:hypothetical protein [Streptomyces sp. NPDC057199]|uniref:hypothetical protein n=1 Tax=Streptomyces sp. NPDC057199 TaxID=3346047 RepID=UPI00362EA7D7